MEAIPIPYWKELIFKPISKSRPLISELSTFTPQTVSFLYSLKPSKAHSLGGVSNSWANAWIKNHGTVCAAANKPCILEEYGTTSDHVAIESPWQATSLSTNGVAGDMFWQWGDTLSTGQTHNDGHTIYYGSNDYQSLVVNHVAAIGGGSGTPTTTTPTSTGTPSTG